MGNTRLNILLIITLCAAIPSATAAQTNSPPPPSASEMRELYTSLDELFKGMKNGDVVVIQQHLSGLSEYKVLLEQNKDYPAFLRDFYRGATFSISRVTPTADGGMVVDVVIQLAGGSRSVTQLNVKRFDDAPAKWRVIGVVKEERTSTRNAHNK